MTPKQQELLARYRELWADYNATRSLIDLLEERLRKIKAGQRRLANLIAAIDAEERGEPLDYPVSEKRKETT